MVEITSVIKDATRVGWLSSTVSMLANTNLSLKDLLALESSKLVEKMQKEWNVFTSRKNDSTLVLSRELDKFIIYLYFICRRNLSIKRYNK